MTAVHQENCHSPPSGWLAGEGDADRHTQVTSLRYRSAERSADPRPADGTQPGVEELQERLRAAESRADNLEIALRSNRRIGMAIGVLLARHLTEEQAFDALRQESMRRNVKLRDLAEEVIYTGTL
jgi:tetrahydromethanopterin S-methyltransferase subunit F